MSRFPERFLMRIARLSDVHWHSKPFGSSAASKLNNRELFAPPDASKQFHNIELDIAHHQPLHESPFKQNIKTNHQRIVVILNGNSKQQKKRKYLEDDAKIHIFLRETFHRPTNTITDTNTYVRYLDSCTSTRADPQNVLRATNTWKDWTVVAADSLSRAVRVSDRTCTAVPGISQNPVCVSRRSVSFREDNKCVYIRLRPAARLWWNALPISCSLTFVWNCTHDVAYISQPNYSRHVNQPKLTRRKIQKITALLDTILLF